MKNLLTNFGNAFNPQRFFNLLKRVKRWDLLFIDDHGKVVSFQYVRGLLISFGVVNLILLGGLIYLYLLHTSSIKKNSELQNTLEVSLQESKALQQEVNALMIQLAEAQSKISKSPGQKKRKTIKKTSADTKKGNTAVIHRVEAMADKQKKVASKPLKPVADTTLDKTTTSTHSEARPQLAQAKKKEIPASSEKKEPLIYDFSAFHDSQLSSLNVRFSIKNPDRSSSGISGYIFVLMKENDHNQKSWFPLPWVELVAGKPSRVEEGHFFRIRNFKTVEMQSVDVTGPRTFNKATLLVFSPSGELLLKKTFPVIINVPGIPTEAAVLEAEPPKPTEVLPKPEEIEPVTAVEEGPGIQSDSEEIILNEAPKEDAGEDTVPAITE